MSKSVFRPIDHITAEFIKLRNTPVPYLILLSVSFIGFIVFMSHFMDVHNVVKIGVNPWDRFFKGTMAIYSVFVLTPFIILIISGKAFIEQRANALKYIYATPVKRGHIYFYKLIVILMLLALFVLSMTLVLFFVAYLLNMLHPETGFNYYSPDLLAFFKLNVHSYIAILGVVGIQFFLCMNTKNFMIPLGVGIFGFILAFILMLTASKYSVYVPYEYPMIVKDFGMVNSPFRTETGLGFLNNIERNSIICFLFFVVLGYILELRKNID